MIVKVNYESGFNFSLLKSRELIEVKEEVIDGKKLVKNSETFSGQTAGEADYGGRTRDIELGRLAFYH